MRTISDAMRAILNSGKQVGNNALIWKVVLVTWSGSEWVETTIPQVESINITKEETAAQSCDFTIVNVNPSDPTDYGYFNAHRNDTTHGKPQNSWYKVLVPNTRIRVYASYGNSDFITQFYGFIDTIDIDIQPDGAKLTIKCRDVSKILLDRYCNSTDTGVKSYYIAYPIGASVTPVYLDDGDTDPTLEDIVKDICMRAGFIEADIVTETSGFTLADIDGFIEFEEISWSDCIEQLKTKTGFDYWADEDGKLHFAHPQSQSHVVIDEEEMLIDEDPQPLLHPQVIESSLIVKSYDGNITYDLGDDYIFDSTDNSIARTPDSAIYSYDIVKVSYTYGDYIFKNGQNIMTLPLTMSHDKIYGTIIVRGDGVEYKIPISVDYKLWDGSQTWEDKILIVSDTGLLTEGDCQSVAERLLADMKERYISTEFRCQMIPHLQLRDVVQVVVYGTINELYIIDGIRLSYTANTGSTEMILKTHHFQGVSLE